MEQFALVIGESLIDVVGAARLPGGSPMNVAVGLGRLGRPVKLATWFGQDTDGGLIAAHLASSHVGVVPGSDGAAHTSTAQVVFDDAGSASYMFDLEWRLAGLVGDLHPIVVHTGSIAAALQPGADDVLTALRAMRGTATISFDPNVRPQIIGPADDVRPLMDEFVRLADIVKVSDEDLAWLNPGVPPIETARRWAAGENPALVVLTKGAQGVTAIIRGGEYDVAAPAVQVADTVGAGDAFMAGLLHALWGDGLLCDRGLNHISEPALLHALTVATQVAAITLSRPGADPPWSWELESPA
ncbi:MAG: carbohydrate kinase [Propionibacteriaceae bacterium]|nr:carbohydrate kinase [Propionibacteriaceae bacterium]